MHQVAAHSMAPGHVAPVDAGRIVLEKQMVFALVENKSVRVVVPAFLGREMKLRTPGFAVEHIGHDLLCHPLVALNDLIRVDVAPTPVRLSPTSRWANWPINSRRSHVAQSNC